MIVKVCTILSWEMVLGFQTLEVLNIASCDNNWNTWIHPIAVDLPCPFKRERQHVPDANLCSWRGNVDKAYKIRVSVYSNDTSVRQIMGELTEPCVFNFYQFIFEDSMILDRLGKQIELENLARKQEHTANLVEALMKRYS